MGVYPEGKALQNLKPTIAALVLNGVLGLSWGNGEVGRIVDHACREGCRLGGHAQSDP